MMNEASGPGTLCGDAGSTGFLGSGSSKCLVSQEKRGQLITTGISLQLLAAFGFGILSFSSIFLIKPTMQMCNTLIGQTRKALIILLI